MADTEDPALKVYIIPQMTYIIYINFYKLKHYKYAL